MNTPAIASLATAALLGSVAVAHAEPADPLPYRSAATATWLSLGGIAASGLMIAAGAGVGGDAGLAIGIVGAGSLLLTPSAGHFYSGRYLTTGLISRVAGTAAMWIGGYLSLRSWDLFPTAKEDDDDDDEEALGLVTFFGGGVAFVTGTILDVATAGSAAHAWNEKHRLTLAPTAISTPAGSSWGLGLGGQF